MLEIIALIVLLGKIGDMARRRGRSPSLFGVLLLVGWFGGEVAGGAVGYLLGRTTDASKPDILVIYSLAIAGAAIGAVVAFLIARVTGPRDGVWRTLDESLVRRSRLLGAIVGGVGGGVLGAGMAAFVQRDQGIDQMLPVAIQAFLGVGLLGALLGMVSGLQKE